MPLMLTAADMLLPSLDWWRAPTPTYAVATAIRQALFRPVGKRLHPREGPHRYGFRRTTKFIERAGQSVAGG